MYPSKEKGKGKKGKYNQKKGINPIHSIHSSVQYNRNKKSRSLHEHVYTRWTNEKQQRKRTLKCSILASMR